MSWQQHAACRGLTELFYPVVGDHNVEARKVCHECPVQAECLEHAIVNGERFGIWGGHTPKELRVLRRDRHRGAA